MFRIGTSGYNYPEWRGSPAGTRAAFEFRHPSWLSDDVYDLLRSRNLALCVADSSTADTPLVMMASYGYFRLRDEGYSEEDIAGWADTIGGVAADRDVYVFFKHEQAGRGPAFASALRQHLDAAV